MDFKPRRNYRKETRHTIGYVRRDFSAASSVVAVSENVSVQQNNKPRRSAPFKKTIGRLMVWFASKLRPLLSSLGRIIPQLKINPQRLQPAALVFLLIFSIVVPFLPTEFASAATAIALPDGDITTQWAGEATPHWSKIDEDVQGTINTADYIATGPTSTSNTNAAEEFTFGTVANVTSASTVTVRINSKSQTNANGGELDVLAVQLRIGGVLQGAIDITPQYDATATNYPTTSNLAFNGSWTQGDIDGMQVLITRKVFGGGNPTNARDDVRIAAMSVTVTYTPGMNFEQSAYRWFENQDTNESTFAKSWGGTASDISHEVIQTSDGGFAAISSTESTNLSAGLADQMLIKYNSNGVEQWSKTWGGTGTEIPYAIVQTLDGGYAVAGYTSSTDRTAGGNDQTLIKYNPSGVEQWSKTWGGTGDDVAYAMVETSAGDLIVAGYTGSTDRSAGGNDQSLVKYSSSGVEQWSKTWGGAGADVAYALVATTDGGFAVVGITDSSGMTAGLYDQTLVKYDSTGIEQWSKTWGGANYDGAYSVAQTPDDGLIVVGYSNSAEFTAGSYDQTLVKYNSTGIEQWSKTWGGSGDEVSNAIAVTSDGGFVAVGYTNSTDRSVGGADQTLVKYNSTGIEQWSKTWGGSGAEDATGIMQTSDGSLVVTGYTDSPGMTTGSNDGTLLKLYSDGTIDNCSQCVDRAVAETDRAATETDRAATETDRAVAETDRALAETDRTGVATITNICLPLVGVGAGLAALSTAATAAAEGTLFRLRMNLHVSLASPSPGDAVFKLQFAQRGADNLCDTSFTNETYSDLSPSSGVIRYADNTNAVDGQSLQTNANDPTHLGHSVTAQTYEENNDFGITTAIPVDNDGMWDFALVDNSAPASTTYCFRAVYSTGGLLNTYSVIPEITTQNATLEQSGYRWFENQDGTESNTLVSAWGGTLVDYGRDIVQTTDGGYAVVGYTTSFGAGNNDQFIVKYDNKGQEQWSKTWGGSDQDHAFGVVQTSDGGYAVAGSTIGIGAGARDQTLVKYNSSGVEQWSKTWGGAGDEYAQAIIETADGGLAVVGYSNSFGAGQNDQTLVKYNSSGVEQWSKTWGGAGIDYGYDVQQTSDDGFVVAGYSTSFGAGGNDQTLVKFDQNGVEQWSKTWGGSGEDFAMKVVTASDGGFVVAGYSTSYGAGDYDQTLVKYNSSGVEQWSKTWGGSGTDQAFGVDPTHDSGFILAGFTTSFGAGGNDQTLVKFDQNGVEQWSKIWGGSANEVPLSVVTTRDGGYATAGYTMSHGAGDRDQSLIKYDNSGDIANCGPPNCQNINITEGNHNITEADQAITEGNQNITEGNQNITETDQTSASTQTYVAGHLTFAKSWGGTGGDEGFDVVQADDGGYVVTGNTASFSAGGLDVALTKYRANGTEEWSRTWGGTGDETPQTLLKTSDGGYIVAGYTLSYGAGNYDQFLAKFNASGTEQWSNTWGGGGNDYTRWMDHTSDGGYIVVGETDSYTAGGVDFYIAKFNSTGVEQWTKTWGGTGADYGRGVTETADGGFILAGYSNSFGGTNQEAIIVKLNSNGVEQWSKRWGSSGHDYGYHVTQTRDGGYVMTGRTDTYDTGDAILVRFDANGIEQWSKTWSGSGLDTVYQVVENGDGDLFTVGRTASFGSGGDEQLVMKYNSSGIEQWSKVFGGTGNEIARRLTLADDGGFITVGGTPSSGFTAGAGDHSILKYDKDGKVVGCSDTVCRDVTITETDRAFTEVDVATSETDRAVTEATITVTEVDRTSSTVETGVVAPAPWLALYNVPGTALSPANSMLTDIRRDGIYRLRLAQHVGTKRTSAGSVNFKLQMAPRVGTCDAGFVGEQYSDVTNASGIKYYTGNTNFVDGNAIAQSGADPSHGGHLMVLQSLETANNYSVRNDILPDQDGLWDFPLAIDANALGGSWCLRAVKADGTNLNTYTHVVEINVPLKSGQQLRHGRFFTAGGESRPFSW